MSRALWVALTVVAMLLSVRSAEAFECSMSGARSCPCACSAGDDDHDHDTSAQFQRRACCEARPVATAAPATLDASVHLELAIPPAPVGALVRLAPGRATTRPAARGRGPPVAGPRAFVAHCSFLL